MRSLYAICIASFSYFKHRVFQALSSWPYWGSGSVEDTSPDLNDDASESRRKGSALLTTRSVLSGASNTVVTRMTGSKVDGKKLINLAKSQHGKPYKMRLWDTHEVYGRDPKDFDCSSFVMWLYFRFGFKLPRTSREQAYFCKRIIPKEIKVGDLFFLGNGGQKSEVNHVGMYIGSGQCIESAGGKAQKVVYSWLDTILTRHDVVMLGRVPLEVAEDRFFDYVKKYPKGADHGATKKEDEKQE